MAKHFYTAFVTCAVVQDLEQMLCPVFAPGVKRTAQGPQRLSLHSLCVCTTDLFSMVYTTPVTCMSNAHSWPHWWHHPMHSTSCYSAFVANTFLATALQTILWEVMASEGWQGDSASQSDEPSKVINLWVNLAILEWLVLRNWQRATFPNMVSIAVKTKHGATSTTKVVSHSTQSVWVMQVICNTPRRRVDY